MICEVEIGYYDFLFLLFGVDEYQDCRLIDVCSKVWQKFVLVFFGLFGKWKLS